VVEAEVVEVRERLWEELGCWEDLSCDEPGCDQPCRDEAGCDQSCWDEPDFTRHTSRHRGAAWGRAYSIKPTAHLMEPPR
jgi:hypothetical protein